MVASIGSGDQIHEIPGSGFAPLERTSVGPRSNSRGGLVGGGGPLLLR